MTKLKGIAFAFFLMVFTSAVFAHNTSFTSEQQIRKDIAKHLQNIDLSQFNVEEVTVQLTFLVNTNDEIVVLSTNNGEFDKLLKSHLNYKSLTVHPSSRNQIYIVPITLKG